MASVKTIFIQTSAVPQITKFNLYEQIVSKFAQRSVVNRAFEAVADFFKGRLLQDRSTQQTELVPSSTEYRVVQGFFESTAQGNVTVNSIVKLENKKVQTAFMTELSRDFEDRYPNKEPSQLIKLLFHGSAKTPKEIFEHGLDTRTAQAGPCGQGLYFADNSSHFLNNCTSVAHGGAQYNCMFAVFVLPGMSSPQAENGQ